MFGSSVLSSNGKSSSIWSKLSSSGGAGNGRDDESLELLELLLDWPDFSVSFGSGQIEHNIV